MVKGKSNAKNFKLTAKLQSLTIEQKACLFILCMGVIGAAIGGISAEIDIRNCNANEQCIIVNMTLKRLEGITQGAFAGMGAAIFSSLPTLFKRFRQ